MGHSIKIVSIEVDKWYSGICITFCQGFLGVPKYDLVKIYRVSQKKDDKCLKAYRGLKMSYR